MRKIIANSSNELFIQLLGYFEKLQKSLTLRRTPSPFQLERGYSRQHMTTGVTHRHLEFKNPIEFENTYEGDILSRGHHFVDTGKTFLLGLCPGSSYYHAGHVFSMVKDVVNLPNSPQRIIVVIPGPPSVHTFKAKGVSNPERKARSEEKTLKKHIIDALIKHYEHRNATDKEKFDPDETLEKIKTQYGLNISFLNWEAEVDKSSEYIESLEKVKKLYELDESFRSDIRSITGHVQDIEEEDIDEAVIYLLSELALFDVMPKICSSTEEPEDMTLLYHLDCQVLRKFIDRKYDLFEIGLSNYSNNFGFVVADLVYNLESLQELITTLKNAINGEPGAISEINSVIHTLEDFIKNGPILNEHITISEA